MIKNSSFATKKKKTAFYCVASVVLFSMMLLAPTWNFKGIFILIYTGWSLWVVEAVVIRKDKKRAAILAFWAFVSFLPSILLYILFSTG